MTDAGDDGLPGPDGAASPTLGELLVEEAAAAEDVVVAARESASEVTAGGHVVAVIHTDALEVRLRPAVVLAALRTPDVEAGARGRDWIRFAPATLDEFAIDRATAWLASAIRLGTGGSDAD